MTLDIDVILTDPTKHIIVCTGAGGVGKTTTAAALGLRAAELGRNVCVLTIDPARRLAQARGHVLHQLQLSLRVGRRGDVPQLLDLLVHLRLHEVVGRRQSFEGGAHDAEDFLQGVAHLTDRGLVVGDGVELDGELVEAAGDRAHFLGARGRYDLLDALPDALLQLLRRIGQVLPDNFAGRRLDLDHA